MPVAVLRLIVLKQNFIVKSEKQYGTHYSYGEYSALVREGKIMSEVMSEVWGSEKAGEKEKAGKK